MRTVIRGQAQEKIAEDNDKAGRWLFRSDISHPCSPSGGGGSD